MKSTPPPATRGLSVISLLFAAGIDNDNLPQILRTAKNGGADGLELTYHPKLLSANPATILKSAKTILPIRALCAFNGADDPNPLGDRKDRGVCQDRIYGAINLAHMIGEHTGITPIITGPFGFKIGHRYDRQDSRHITTNLTDELKFRGDYAARKGVILAHECLQAPENWAIQGFQHHLEILNRVNMPGFVTEHTDTFHLEQWGEDLADYIRRNHEMIGWFHASGSYRHSPGYGNDHIKWQEGADAMREVDAKFPVCFEGFGKAFRKIGLAYPPDLNGRAALIQAITTLSKVGMIRSN